MEGETPGTLCPAAFVEMMTDTVDCIRVCVRVCVFPGHGGTAGLGEGEEHWRVKLQHPAAGETSDSLLCDSSC